MNNEPTLNADTHARACWLRLVEHAQSGRCTCHLGYGGLVVHVSVNVLNGCSVGRMLKDEYERAKEAVKARARAKLEEGDFDPAFDIVSDGSPQ